MAYAQHHRNDCYSMDNFRKKIQLVHLHCSNITCACTTKMYCVMCVRAGVCYWIIFQFTSSTFCMYKKYRFFTQLHVGTYATAVIRWHKNCVQFKILFQSQSIKINRHSRLTWNNLFTVTINSITRCVYIWCYRGTDSLRLFFSRIFIHFCWKFTFM